MRAIPESFFESPDIISEIIERTGPYKKEESGFAYLAKLKSVAREVWQEKGLLNRDKEKLGELQELMAGIKTVRDLCYVPRSVINKSARWKKIAEESKAALSTKRMKSWRKRIVPKALAAAKKLSNALATSLNLECPFGDSKNWCGSKLSKKRARGRMDIHQITTWNGQVTSQPRVVKRALCKFWGETFGRRREFSADALEKIINTHENRFPTHEYHIVSEKRVREAISRTKKTAPGPDGIPFQLYKAMINEIWEPIANAIQEAGNEDTWSSSFGEARVVLLPKVEGAPKPEQFRPISITNADYRIITRYWATWLGEIIPGAISPHQQAVGKDILIDNAIETVNDTMMERIATKKPTYFLQTDFAKAYDFLNRDAIERILEAVNAPSQIRNVAKKILKEAPISFAIDHRSKGGESVTGVRQGCPLSPIIFCIISDLLVEKLSKCEGVSKLSAYMDDLGIIFDRPETMDKLEEIFTSYENATGAKLNYEKCTVLTNTEDFSPEGKWKKMPEKNYRAKRTIYLGVPIALEFDPNEDWRKAICKFTAVCEKIRKIRASTVDRIKMINTFAIPTLEYLARFKLINREGAKKIWGGLKKALAGKATIPIRALTNKRDLTEFDCTIRHPILQNWALLASRAPAKEGYLNPASIGHARLTARDIVRKKTTIEPNIIDKLQIPSKAILGALQRTISPTNLNNAMKEIWGGGDYKTFLHNIQKAPKKKKRAAMLLLYKGWSLKDQRKHMKVGSDNVCRLCKEKKETYSHIWQECEVAKEMMDELHQISEAIDPSKAALGLGEIRMNHQEVKDCCTAILCLKMALGSYSQKTKPAEWVRKTYRTLTEKPTGKGTKERKTPNSFPPKDEPQQVYYDGSARTDNLAGGAGAMLLKNGEEVGAVAMTIPYGTNNVGEFAAAEIGLKKALEAGWKEVAVVGDCQILTELMKRRVGPSNPRLLEIRIRIEELCSKFEKVNFFHVNREFNKRADAIAFAASIGEETGKKASENTKWNPREDDFTVDQDASFGDDNFWKSLEKDWNKSQIFPLPTNYRQPSFPDEERRVVSNWLFFPDPPKTNDLMLNPIMTKCVNAGLTKVNRLDKFIRTPLPPDRPMYVPTRGSDKMTLIRPPKYKHRRTEASPRRDFREFGSWIERDEKTESNRERLKAQQRMLKEKRKRIREEEKNQRKRRRIETPPSNQPQCQEAPTTVASQDTNNRPG